MWGVGSFGFIFGPSEVAAQSLSPGTEVIPMRMVCTHELGPRA